MNSNVIVTMKNTSIDTHIRGILPIFEGDRDEPFQTHNFHYIKILGVARRKVGVSMGFRS